MGRALAILLALASIGMTVLILAAIDVPQPSRARHHPHLRPPTAQPMPAAEAPHPETHDELVARKRQEASERRRAFCDAHPDLIVRIGC